jgi:hypothetical protein
MQTLIKALYTQLQAIYRSAALSRLSSIATFRVLRVMKERGITYLLTKCGSISLNL